MTSIFQKHKLCFFFIYKKMISSFGYERHQDKLFYIYIYIYIKKEYRKQMQPK
jgi:hypothetical protein